VWEPGTVQPDFLSQIRCVVFDVGETLVDETRIWSDRAERAGLTTFTLCGVLGALIALDRDHSEVWDVIGVDQPEFAAEVGQFDLYPDALECVAAARRSGLTVGIAGNQPAGIEALLRTAGLDADFIASSAAWGVAKPDQRFFLRLSDEAKLPAEDILYVGDRLDNDVLPARKAGMHTVFVRRGPWGHVHALKPEAALADMRVDSLAQLAAWFMSDGD
jgi:HAD superfamily hydrolase (TIGR01509 family)